MDTVLVYKFADLYFFKGAFEMVEPVPDQINFPQAEEEILKLWKELDVFQTCLNQSKGKPR